MDKMFPFIPLSVREFFSLTCRTPTSTVLKGLIFALKSLLKQNNTISRLTRRWIAQLRVRCLFPNNSTDIFSMSTCLHLELLGFVRDNDDNLQIYIYIYMQ